ncbi:hypothetical protein EMIHUDRAFT_124577, partial [Emiliania huxleyi CCMP1516]
GQRGAFVGLGNTEPGTSADVFGLEQRGAVGDGDFRPSDGGGYVAYKKADYAHARSDTDVQMYLFETFGGWCNAVKRLFYQMKDKQGSQPAASCDRPLRACYDAMGGQSWKNAAGRSWLDANIPCCEKAFVTCHKEKEEIRTIAWRSIAGLMGTIPPQLGLLTSLEEINVERTDLSGTLPDALFSASSEIEKAPLPPARTRRPSDIAPPYERIKRTSITGTLPPSLFLSGTLEKEIDLEESYNCGKKSKD